MSDSTLEWAMLLWMLSLLSFWIGFALGLIVKSRKRARFDPALTWSPPPKWQARTVHTTAVQWVDDG